MAKSGALPVFDLVHSGHCRALSNTPQWQLGWPGLAVLGCQWRPAAVTDASLDFTGSGAARSRVGSWSGELAVTLYRVNNQHLAGLLPALKDRLGALAILGEQRQLPWLTMLLLIRGWDRHRVTVTGPQHRADEKILP